MKFTQMTVHFYLAASYISNKYLPKSPSSYVELSELFEYIMSPVLGDDAGIIGSLLLDYQAYTKNY